MTELEKEVINWQTKTFPNAKFKAICDKLDEELEELLKSDDIDNFIIELADVAIVAICFLNRMDTSLSREIKKKLEINKLRKWGDELPNGDRKRDKS